MIFHWNSSFVLLFPLFFSYFAYLLLTWYLYLIFILLNVLRHYIFSSWVPKCLVTHLLYTLMVGFIDHDLILLICSFVWLLLLLWLFLYIWLFMLPSLLVRLFDWSYLCMVVSLCLVSSRHWLKIKKK
jgi:hypothetical protein